VKTTKLYILDVKPKSPARGVESEVLSVYGVEGGERTLPEEFGANELRQKFAKRPGRLTNANVAQPEAEMDVIVGQDNPHFMPAVVYQSINDGKDLFITRNLLYPGEMLCGETSGAAWKKKGAAGGAKTTSTPKPRQQKAKNQQTASKRPGRLSNANVAQPEAEMDVIVGGDNPHLMPVVAYQSINDGTDLFITRNLLHPGEMLCGETSGAAWKKKGAAGGAKTTSTPKPRQQKAKDQQTASKRPVEAAPVQTPAAASRRLEETEERPTAGPSGVRSSRRLDSSPALSVAAFDTMVSSV
jgi:hypothetical protein